MNPANVVAVVPAAGQSSRFGGMKLLSPVSGEPLLDRTLASLIDGGVSSVVVVVSAGARFETVRRLSDPRVRLVVNPDPARGMFSSIQCGVATAVHAASPVDAVLLLPADMPFVAPETIRAVAGECLRAGQPVVATFDGRRGHPLALPAAVLPAIAAANPAGSLKDALAPLGLDAIRLATDDAGVLRDVDVPADLT